MTSSRLATGQTGEAHVAAHLERLGFTVVAQNARVGRLELDVVARRGDLLVFCEVRTRRSRAFVEPIATIDHAKVLRVRKAAAQWLALHPQVTRQVRFDAASVVLDSDPPTLAYYESAF